MTTVPESGRATLLKVRNGALYSQVPGRRLAFFVLRQKDMDTNTLIIVVLLVLLLGGGGFYWRGRR